MIVKVLKTYLDKNTKAVVPSGTLLDIDESRANELKSAHGGPYVEAFSMPAANTAKPEVTKKR